MKENKTIEAIAKAMLIVVVTIGRGLCKVINAIACTDLYIEVII